MLTQLSTLKSRLAIDAFDLQYDSLLTSALTAISFRFDKEANRTLARTENLTQEFDAADTEICLACYPVESVTKFELKTTEPEGWIEQTGIDFLIRRSCILSLHQPFSIQPLAFLPSLIFMFGLHRMFQMRRAIIIALDQAPGILLPDYEQRTTAVYRPPRSRSVCFLDAGGAASARQDVRRNNRMPTDIQSRDEALVESARRLRIDRRKLRRERFLCGTALISACIIMTVIVLRMLAGQAKFELNAGFFTGIFLALIWTTCGFLGALLLAKSLSGFDAGLRTQELLVRYHDQLRELGALPAAKGEPCAPPNGGPATQLGNSRVSEGPPSVS